MRVTRLKNLLTDLISILPNSALVEWSDPNNLTPGKPTVILVSGFAAPQRNLSIMRRRLSKDGFNVLVISMDWTTLSDGIRGLYRMTELLSRTVLELKKTKCKRSPVYLVAHSAGGLVARYYVQLMGGSHYCDALITLGTPHRGTWFSLLGFVTHLILKARCLLQMMPISRFIRKVNGATIPGDCRFVSVSSKDDLLCPKWSTTLPEKSSKVEYVEIPGLSHSDFLLSKRSYRIIRKTLLPDNVLAAVDS